MEVEVVTAEEWVARLAPRCVRWALLSRESLVALDAHPAVAGNAGALTLVVTWWVGWESARCCVP
jgi:hypothetical protein